MSNSVPANYQATCERKAAYATRAEAKRAARDLGRRDRGVRVSAYPCSWCGKFHIGRSGPNRHR